MSNFYEAKKQQKWATWYVCRIIAQENGHFKLTDS